MVLGKSTRACASLLALVLLTVLTGACSSDVNGEDITTQLTAGITHYQTQTPSLVAQDSGDSNEPSAIPQPSATPLIYRVAANDTLIGIATRFNIPLDALIAANPGIDPNFLIIDTDLVIPAQEGSIAAALPSPTPVSLVFGEPRCYTTAAGGVWCLLLVGNEQPNALENLAAMISLHSIEGELVANQEAVALLNVLPSGSRIPLVAFFEPPVPAWAAAKSQILSAISIPSDDGRYLPAVIEIFRTVIDEDGHSARIQGQLTLPAELPPANLVWIVAVAYDEEGLPVGVRRWEYTSETPAGSSLNFEMEVFSLGAPIDSVEILFEVRP